MTALLQSHYPAKTESLSSILKDVLAATTCCGLSDKRRGELELSIEEAVVNVFDHAYGGDSTAGIITVVARVDDKAELSVEIRDDSTPFNPLSAPAPDLDAPIEERAIGGLGVHLMRTLLDDLHYRREDGQNILTLIIRGAHAATCHATRTPKARHTEGPTA